jgi:hypothetical protein
MRPLPTSGSGRVAFVPAEPLVRMALVPLALLGRLRSYPG